jgi:hypothetical protein
VEIFGKLQRNALWRAVTASGLYLGEFSYDPVAWPSGVIIHHAPSDSECRIMKYEGLLYIETKLGDDPSNGAKAGSDFSEIVDEVERWAIEIPEWMGASDLWKSIPESSAVPGDLTPDSANTPFTSDEQAAISAQLKEIAESIKKTYELTAEQSAKLDEKFDEAEKASRRMGRKDWGLLFGGAVFSLILADVITPGIAGHILMMIEHGMGHLFGGPAVGGTLTAGKG